MKKLFSLVFALGLSLSASAIPAKRGSMMVINSDGTTMEISLRGDEAFHFYVRTSDGTPVYRNATGDWVEDPRDVHLLWKEANMRRNTHRVQLAQKMRRAMRVPSRAASADAASTIKKGLLILVNFSDKKFSNDDATSNAIFTQMVNGINNPYEKNFGSVREYFLSQSYNQLDIEFDVVGPVTLSKTMSYYGGNDSDGNDLHPDEMVTDAIKMVDDEVNFADYDWDGDGEVENIYITYAGYSEAAGAAANTVWPHQWQISEATGKAVSVDGVIVDTYACGSELDGKSGKTIAGIGTMCHEYSHCLGLPDFYDVNYGSCEDMAEWSLMAMGCDNNGGFTPCGYTSYERWFCGWLEPTVLNAPTNISEMKPLTEAPEAYVIYNDNNPNEYYMLANHQQTSWDSEIQGHGMMILHVDYSKKAWENNAVNTTKGHPRMGIIPADDELYYSSGYYWADDGDLWPGTKNNTALTDSSEPAASLYNANSDGKKFMHKDIENITEENGTISFTFMGGEVLIEAPVATEATDVTATSFTANWQPVENAVSYELSLTESYDDGEEEPSLDILAYVTMEENFQYFYADESATSDGTSDLSANLDEYTLESGWSGEKVFQGLFGAKLGTSSKKGYLTSPLLECKTGNTTIYLDAYDWFNYSNYANNGTYKTDGSTLDVILLDESGNELQKQNVEVADMAELGENEYPEIVVTFENVPENYSICLSTTAGKKRVYLTYFLVFDGYFTLDEINVLFEEESAEAPRRSARDIKTNAIAKEPWRKIVTTTSSFGDITETSYTLNDLTPGADYSYRVRAIDAEGNKSVWSNVIHLTMSYDEVSVASVQTGVHPSLVTYDLSGRRVRSNSLSRGIYIQNGQKFFIK
ncbi:MAG: M6 family metalloprotease domain-containing protein [Bacteroidales bacterium]|nr:M6 family metalloprotease domain-containing protein [Bacteroidales bacterium]